MNSARYGQVAPNRCFELDEDYLQCVSDILGMADGKCSGLRQCEVPIPNAEFSGTKECFRRTGSYLEASFTCVTDGDHQICQFHSFTPRCPQHDVIVINRAMYGQVAPNTCFELLDFSDCVSNVLGIADGMCSGIRQCEVMIPNAQFSGTRQCFRQAMSYFEVSYSCLTVSHINDLCQNFPTIKVSSNELKISSAQIAACGSGVRPLRFFAEPGQQINVTILDFKWASTSSSSPRSGCKNYGLVTDERTSRREDICGGQQREHQLTLSTSNSIRMDLNPVDDDMRYLLLISAQGCVEPVPPAGSWMNRSQSQVTIGCLTGGPVWNLRCHNSKWIGQFGECVDVPVENDEAGVVTKSKKVTLPNDIIIAIIGALAFLIGVLIITVGVVHYKRSSLKRKRILMQQKQAIEFQTIIRKHLTTKRRDKKREESLYLTPTSMKERPLSATSAGTRPDSTYESIQVFNRALPDVASNTNTMASSMNTMPSSAHAMAAGAQPAGATAILVPTSAIPASVQAPLSNTMTTSAQSEYANTMMLDPVPMATNSAMTGSIVSTAGGTLLVHLPSTASSCTSDDTLRQTDEDIYNNSQSSSSTYTNPRKYYVLDKNFVNQNENVK